MSNYPSSLSTDSLMAHLWAICKQLPRRQPTTEGERLAAEHVQQKLISAGLKDVHIQTFKGIPTIGVNALTIAIAGLLSIVLGWLAGSPGGWVAGGLMLVVAFAFWQVYRPSPPFFGQFVERWKSWNVIASIPAKKTAKKHIFLDETQPNDDHYFAVFGWAFFLARAVNKHQFFLVSIHHCPDYFGADNGFSLR